MVVPHVTDYLQIKPEVYFKTWLPSQNNYIFLVIPLLFKKGYKIPNTVGIPRKNKLPVKRNRDFSGMLVIYYVAHLKFCRRSVTVGNKNLTNKNNFRLLNKFCLGSRANICVSLYNARRQTTKKMFIKRHKLHRLNVTHWFSHLLLISTCIQIVIWLLFQVLGLWLVTCTFADPIRVKKRFVYILIFMTYIVLTYHFIWKQKIGIPHVSLWRT